MRVAADTFRQNPVIDTPVMISELGIGEALISTLDAQGKPTMVDWCLLSPPRSQIGPVDSALKQRLTANSPLSTTYNTVIDRQSAYEMLAERASAQPLRQQTTPVPPTQAPVGGVGQILQAGQNLFGAGASGRQSVGEILVKTVVRSVGSQIGRSLVRGLLGSLSGKR